MCVCAESPASSLTYLGSVVGPSPYISVVFGEDITIVTTYVNTVQVACKIAWIICTV